MRLLNFLSLALLVTLTLSCSTDDLDADSNSEITVLDFEGSWKAFSAVYTKKSNTSESVEFIGAGGEIRFTMVPGGQGRTRIWIEFQENAVDEWDATMSLGSNSTYTLTPAESSRPVQTGTYTLENNTLTLTNDNTTFDFDNSGTNVPATSVIDFERN